MTTIRTLAIVALAVAAPWTLASEHLVAQKDKSFSTKTLNIKVGDVVAFRNDKTGPPSSDPLCLCVSGFLVLK